MSDTDLDPPVEQSANVDCGPATCSVLHVCSAHKECQIPADQCRHKTPHVCDEKGMHRFSECYTSKIVSACLTIRDGKIPVSRWDTCPHCGRSEHLTEMVPVDTPNAALSGGDRVHQSDNSNDNEL